MALFDKCYLADRAPMRKDEVTGFHNAVRDAVCKLVRDIHPVTFEGSICPNIGAANYWYALGNIDVCFHSGTEWADGNSAWLVSGQFSERD